MSVLTLGRVLTVLAVLTAALGCAVFVGLWTGPSSLAGGDVLAALLGDGTPAASDIVLRIRLPRVLLGSAVGASLALSGVLFQALLRNPLADPYILGVSGGAALGAIVVMSLGASVGLGAAAVPPAAFAGCLLTTLLLYAVAGLQGRLSPTHLLLTGVVFNAFASAAIVFLASVSGRVEGTNIFLWLIGSLSASRAEVAPWVAGFLALGLACSLPMARNLNLLALGKNRRSSSASRSSDTNE